MLSRLPRRRCGKLQLGKPTFTANYTILCTRQRHRCSLFQHHSTVPDLLLPTNRLWFAGGGLIALGMSRLYDDTTSDRLIVPQEQSTITTYRRGCLRHPYTEDHPRRMHIITSPLIPVTHAPASAHTPSYGNRHRFPWAEFTGPSQTASETRSTISTARQRRTRTHAPPHSL